MDKHWKVIKVGTRKSSLARAQTAIVTEYIERSFEGFHTEAVALTTTGDRILDKKLDAIGGKGLFVKELDTALRSGATDLSVHSLKDMPGEIPEDLPIIGFSVREDARDVLVLPEGKKDYDYAAPIGSSSNRRILQLKEIYPEAEFKNIRGNVLTRLKKLDQGEYGALVLAAAGLKRLGLEGRISRYFSVEEMIPAAGQGILCIQGRAGEDYTYLKDFFNEDSRQCALCERAFVAHLNGSCALPIGAYARILDSHKMSIRGLYYDEETKVYKKMSLAGDRLYPEALGILLAEKLKEECRRVVSGKERL